MTIKIIRDFYEMIMLSISFNLLCGANIKRIIVYNTTPHDINLQTQMTVIGIDLGTTNCCFGYIKNGHLMLIDNENGSFQTPSVVLFTDEGERIIGSSAIDIAHLHPDTFIYETKRIIGQSMENPEVQKDIRRFTYKVEDDFDAPKIVKNEREKLYSEQISGYLIEKILERAKIRLNEKITEAVITIPAYFGDFQRKATKDAAKLAGLKTVHIINEPTAAALAFQHANKKSYERNILVYDFGGGTFDVSIVRTQGNHCKVLAIDGDCHLGGTNIDMNLVDFITKDLFDNNKLSGGEIDKVKIRRLKQVAEKAKQCLSNLLRYTIEFPHIFPGIDYSLVMTRPKFEKINQGTFERSLQIVDKCISESSLSKDQIDEVVLVGGSTRIPKIREMLEAYFGKEKINVTSNPDEIVAYGAAVYAESLYGNKKEIFTIEDVLSLSLGTDVVGNEMSVIIKRNTPIPCEASKTYTTIEDDQIEMRIKVYQGERLIASENNLLGDFSVSNLTPAPRGNVLVDITLNVDSEGILSVTAKEQNTDNEKILVINLKNHRLQRSEIGKILKEAENQRTADLHIVNLRNKKAEFENFAFDLLEEAENLDRKDFVLKEIDRILNEFYNLDANEADEIDKLKTKLLGIVSNGRK